MKAKKSPTNLVTVSEFAKIMGVGRQAVDHATQKGRIPFQKVNGRKMIEPVEAKGLWLAGRSKTAYNKNPSGLAKPKTESPKVEEGVGAQFKGVTIAESERRDKYYKAKLAEIKYEKEAGELVSAQEIEKIAFELARKLRDKIMSVPTRVSHELAAETDPHAMEKMLTGILAKALGDLIEEEKENGNVTDTRRPSESPPALSAGENRSH